MSRVHLESCAQEKDTDEFYELCTLANLGILKGCYCSAYDRQFDGRYMPAANWTRDDHLGGERQLADMLQWLKKNDGQAEALEKKERR